jgi:dTDP-4-amino-4,6-dideoxygalactose transaminase
MDCDEYYTIDINKTIDFIDKKTKTIRKKISGKDIAITINKKTGNRITAIIIVHVFGNVANLGRLVNLCKKKILHY